MYVVGRTPWREAVPLREAGAGGVAFLSRLRVDHLGMPRTLLGSLSAALLASGRLLRCLSPCRFGRQLLLGRHRRWLGELPKEVVEGGVRR